MVSPETVLFAIRAGIRIGTAVGESIDQKARDADIRLPSIKTVSLSDQGMMLSYFRTELSHLVAAPPLSEFWDPVAQGGQGGPRDADAVPVLMDAFRKEGAGVTFRGVYFTEAKLGEATLKQWNDEQGPPSPWVRIALSLVEVGLEYAQTDPSLFGLEGNGARFVTALAGEIQELLPDADDPNDWSSTEWNRYYFAERTLSLLLHAGLKTVAANPSLVANEEHVQDLVKRTTAPLLEVFSSADTDPVTFLALQETLLGPVAQAAFVTLAEHQDAFLGERFDRNRAVGAVTAAVLGVASEGGLRQLANDGTLVRLASAAVGVAAARPELFVGGDDAQIKTARLLLAGVATTIRDATKDGSISGGLVADIAKTVLETVAEHGAGLFALDQDNAWEAVAAASIRRVALGLSEGLGADGAKAFEKLFSRDQAVELVRIVLAQAARTPGMLIGGDGRDEVQAIISGLAAAMASDRKLLLAPEDWHRIAAVAAREAARNPNRLFGVDPTSPGEQIGARVIQTILEGAATAFEAKGLRSGALSFGPVLADAITVALEAAVGNLPGARQAVGLVPVSGATLDNLGGLVEVLNALAESKGFGSREWSWLFRQLVVEAIDGGRELNLGTERLQNLLLERIEPTGGIVA